MQSNYVKSMTDALRWVPPQVLAAQGAGQAQRLVAGLLYPRRVDVRGGIRGGVLAGAGVSEFAGDVADHDFWPWRREPQSVNNGERVLRWDP